MEEFENIDPTSARSSAMLEAKRDMTIAWRYYRENWKPFLGCFFFAIGCLLLVVLGISIVASLVIPLVQDTNDIGFEITMYVFIVVLMGVGLFLYYAFLNAQYGLAYDIMSSGDGFAEFKGAFSYFKRFWWQYPLLTLLLSSASIIFGLNIGGLFTLQVTFVESGSQSAQPPEDSTNLTVENIALLVALLTIYFFWYCVWNQAFPSLTAQGKFIKSLKESVALFRNNPRRIVYSWGLFYLVFQVPIYLLALVMVWASAAFPLSTTFYAIVFLITALTFLLAIMGGAISSLIATRIYNTCLPTISSAELKPISFE
jgi:hypothetical protein